MSSASGHVNPGLWRPHSASTSTTLWGAHGTCQPITAKVLRTVREIVERLDPLTLTVLCFLNPLLITLYVTAHGCLRVVNIPSRRACNALCSSNSVIFVVRAFHIYRKWIYYFWNQYLRACHAYSHSTQCDSKRSRIIIFYFKQFISFCSGIKKWLYISE